MGLSLWHIVMLIMAFVVPVICFWQILPRAGIPAPVSLAALIPFGNVVLLLVLAFKKWPGDEEASQ